MIIGDDRRWALGAEMIIDEEIQDLRRQNLYHLALWVETHSKKGVHSSPNKMS